MILYITRDRNPDGGFYSAASQQYSPGRTDDEIRIVRDFPDEEWEKGSREGFPLDPVNPDSLYPGQVPGSDVYWYPWWLTGETIWSR